MSFEFLKFKNKKKISKEREKFEMSLEETLADLVIFKFENEEKLARKLSKDLTILRQRTLKTICAGCTRLVFF